MASGAYDVAMAVGVEKLKDSGYQGLNAFPIPSDGTDRTLTAAAMFSMVVPGLRQASTAWTIDEMQAGAGPDRLEEPRQRGAQRAGPVPQGDDASRSCSPCRAVAGELSVFDCAGVADGAAAAIVVRAEDAHRYTRSPIYIKALSFVAGRRQRG